MTRTTIRCPHCGYAMAQTDGQKLYIACVEFRRAVTLHCGQADCRGKRVWQPRATHARSRLTAATVGAILEPDHN